MHLIQDRFRQTVTGQEEHDMSQAGCLGRGQDGFNRSVTNQAKRVQSPAPAQTITVNIERNETVAASAVNIIELI